MSDDEYVTPSKNVIIFGETGSGKSSIINMLVGENVAPVSDSAVGCTLDFVPYEHESYVFYDTAGLSEGSNGQVNYRDAISNLAKLLKSVKNGINLLIFVMKKDRIKKSLEENYDMFVNVICNQSVPIILVVTHCEQEQVMGDWWNNNKQYFDKYGMEFKDCICVCATKGEKLLHDFAKLMENRYEESRKILNNSIEEHILPIGWKMKNWQEWFGAVLKKFYNKFCTILKWPHVSLWPKLKELFLNAGLDDQTATKLSNDLYETV